MEGLEAGREAAERVGSPGWRLLSAEEARAELASPLYLGALLVARATRSSTRSRLVEGLRGEARRSAACAMYESTAVSAILVRGGTASSSRPANGSVPCRQRRSRDQRVLASALRPSLAKRFLPLYDYILVSEPLTPAQRAVDRVAVAGAASSDARTFFNYYRLTADDRILWGTSEAVYYPGNRVGPRRATTRPQHYAALEASFRRHFPQLAELRVPVPLGRADRLDDAADAVLRHAAPAGSPTGSGYTGHGIGSTRIAGRILAHLALERKSPLLDLSMVRRKPFPYPPEPLRRLPCAVTGRCGASMRAAAGSS